MVNFFADAKRRLSYFFSGPVKYENLLDEIEPQDIKTVLEKDAIIAITETKFVVNQEAESEMLDQEMILGLQSKEDIRAYPISILSVHEIVNDQVGEVPVAVTW